MTLVEFRDVTKRFKNAEALRGVSFSIPDKSVTAFLGPNGAGKTTSMKLIMGFLKPNGGTIRVWGEDPWRSEEVRKRIGFMPEKPVYPMELTVEDFLGHLARLRKVGKTELDRLVRLVGLEKMLDTKIGALSRGYVQRVGIAQSLLGDPELLVLDEPTANLDPSTRREIIELLRVLHRELGVSMIISSHIIPELQEVSNFSVFIDRGVVLEYGFLGDLWKKYMAEAVFTIEARDINSLGKLLIEKPYIRSVKKVDKRFLEVAVEPEYYRSLESLLAEMGELVISFSFKTASLGDLYEKIVSSRS
jgi:ABC-type multidrug transport system ATPase subunit